MSHKFRGADLIVRTLSAAGVRRLFSLSGNQIMPIYDACIDEGLEPIHVRHEAAAVHMADAWGRLTGEPGVALLTAGPGHANALSALYVAWAAESPLVLLSGHSPRSQLERGSFQEMAQAELAGYVAKASWTVGDTSQLGHELARALRTAGSGRPGPVHISLPVDVLQAEVDDSQHTIPQPDDFRPSMTLLDALTAESILSAISKADRPLILTGPSSMHGQNVCLLDQLAEKTGVPVVGMESPRGINDPSLGAVAEVLAEADLIVLIGKRLDFTLRFGEEPAIGKQCRFIHVDPETSILQRTSQALGGSDRLLSADLADMVPAIGRLIELSEQVSRPNRVWFDEVQAAVGYRPAEWDTVSTTGDNQLHPVEICRAVRKFLAADDDAVFISDGGEFGQWAQACITAPHRLINGPAGSIGTAIPFAAAARFVYPASRIVVTLGDGTFGFHATEFDTAVRYKLPFIAVVGNDACWNAERQIQIRDYGRHRQIGCDLLPTRYDEIVRAMGGHGEFVTKADELPAALDRAFASGLPACVNVALDGLAAPVIRRSTRPGGGA
jgi:acetolactate synthase-1/2/3 large subunit